MTPPRMAYVTNVQVPAGDAQSRQIQSMAQAFSKVAPDFALITPWFPGQEGVQVSYPWVRVRVPLARRMLRYVCFGLRLPWILKRRRTELVFTRDIGVALVAWLCGCRVIYEVHKAAKPAARRLMEWLGQSPRMRFAAISQALQNYLTDDLGVPLERTFVAHDAVDVERFAQLRQTSKAQWREKLGLPVDKTILVHSGNASVERGFELVEPLLRSSHDFLFVQVGGREGDIARWKEKFAGLSKILFVPRQEQGVVFQYQLAADLGVYLITEKAEIWWCSSPLKIFEYLAAGTPILASGIGSIGEVLSAENSICFDPKDPQGLLKGFEAFLADRDGAQTRANQALQSPAATTRWTDRCRQLLAFDQGAAWT